ncbi:MAG: tetratricopeptide repeat protein [Planctomycetaceae bacterium]
MGALLDGGKEACGGEEELALVHAAVELQREKFDNSLQQIAKVNPNGRFRATALWIAGESLYRKGDLGAALPLLTVLVGETPSHLRGRKCLAALYFDLGAMDYAKRELKQVCEMEKSDYRPYLMLGQICADYEEFAEAISHFMQALKICPTETLRLEIEGSLALAMCGDRQYQQLLDRSDFSDDEPTIQTCTAEAFWSTGQTQKARRIIDDVLTRHPDLPRTLLLSARLDAGNGKPESAISQLERVLRHDPHNVAARFQLALVSRQIGNESAFEENLRLKEDSQILVDRLLKLSHDVVDKIAPQSVYSEISNVCELLGKKELAERWRQVARGIHSNSPAAATESTMPL